MTYKGQTNTLSIARPREPDPGLIHTAVRLHKKISTVIANLLKPGSGASDQPPLQIPEPVVPIAPSRYANQGERPALSRPPNR